jgi:iron complex transport system substrate-binding protein
MHDTRATVLAALLVVAAVAAIPVGGATTASNGDTVESLQETNEGCDLPYNATDATGTEVTIQERPERIVTLGPGAAQTVVEIGAGDRIVGASQYASYLEGSDGWANVSGPGQTFASVERVVAQEPDLVLAENIVSNETVDKLRSAGITVYRFRSATGLQDVYDKVNRTGRLVDEPYAAAETVAEMRYRIEIARTAAETSESPRALYVFFGYTAGDGTFIDEIITAAGGTNVAAEAGITGYKQISQEVVAQQTVEWLLLNSAGPTVPQSPAYQETIAAKQNRTVVLDRNYVSQPAPRIVEPITKLSKAFYPEAYEAAAAQVAEPTDVKPACAPAETTTESGSATTAAPTTESPRTTTLSNGDESDGQTTTFDQATTTDADAGSGSEGGSGLPGFTPVAAVLALLAALALLVVVGRDR